MLKVTQLAGFGSGGGPLPFASMVFNGVDEALVRTFGATSATPDLFTYSFWVKPLSFRGTPPLGALPLIQIINAPTNTQFLPITVSANKNKMEIFQDFGTVDWSENVSSLSPALSVGTWEHWVFQYDSTQATTDNRIRFYRNGVLQTDADGTSAAPASGEDSIMFRSGFQHQIGAQLDIAAYANVKLAFIEVLDGVSQAASVFGFDNSGVWTRKPYTGSYGTLGFRLDGASGVLGADATGHGQTFTGTNMDASNLDFFDLPPFTP